MRTMFFVEGECGFSGAKDLFYVCAGKNICKVIGNGVFYRCIRRAVYTAFRKHVPKRNPVPKQKIAAFADCAVFFRRIVLKSKNVAEKRFHHRPKSILRVHIKKSCRPRGRRRHRPQNENAALTVPHRCNFMQYFHTCTIPVLPSCFIGLVCLRIRRYSNNRPIQQQSYVIGRIRSNCL